MNTINHKLEKYVNTLAIKVPVYDKETLFNLAGNHYIRLFGGCLPDVNQNEFWYRIIVNFLRHNFTPYELAFKQKCYINRYGKSLLWNRIFCEIANTYPWLKDECIKQLSKKLEL